MKTERREKTERSDGDGEVLCGMMEAVEDQPGLNQPESRYEMNGECEFR